MCAWVLLVELWEFLGRPLPAHLLTQAVTFLGACMMVFLVKTTSITWRELAAIVVTSLAFGALHLFLGLIYMLGAIILLGGLGVLYRRQNTIWGLCIPHYVLGMALVFLGFA